MGNKVCGEEIEEQNKSHVFDGVLLTGAGFIPESAACFTLPSPGPSNTSTRAHFDPVNSVACNLPCGWNRGLAVVVIKSRRGEMKMVTGIAR